MAASAKPNAESHADIPSDAVLGTREFPFAASNETAANFMFRRVICSQVQRVAKILRAAGRRVDFDSWASLLAREMLWLAPGWYEYEDFEAPQRWRDVTPETLLLVGKGAPFEQRADVPKKVWSTVERAIAAARIAGPSVLSRTAIAKRLNVSADFRREHRLFMLGADDVPLAELRSRSKSRRSPEALARKREKDRVRAAERRRAADAVSREKYEAGSIAAQARALGLKPDTLRARLRRAAHVVGPSHGGQSKEGPSAPCYELATRQNEAREARPSRVRSARPSAPPPSLHGSQKEVCAKRDPLEQAPADLPGRRAARPAFQADVRARIERWGAVLTDKGGGVFTIALPMAA